MAQRKTLLILPIVVVLVILFFALDEIYRFLVDIWPWVSLVVWGVLF